LGYDDRPAERFVPPPLLLLDASPSSLLLISLLLPPSLRISSWSIPGSLSSRRYRLPRRGYHSCWNWYVLSPLSISPFITSTTRFLTNPLTPLFFLSQSAPEELTVRPASSEPRTRPFVLSSSLLLSSFALSVELTSFPLFGFLLPQPAGPFGSCFAVTQNQGAAQKVVKRMGVHSNWLVRKIGGVTVSWEKYVKKA